MSSFFIDHGVLLVFYKPDAKQLASRGPSSLLEFPFELGMFLAVVVWPLLVGYVIWVLEQRALYQPTSNADCLAWGLKYVWGVVKFFLVTSGMS